MQNLIRTIFEESGTFSRKEMAESPSNDREKCLALRALALRHAMAEACCRFGGKMKRSSQAQVPGGSHQMFSSMFD